MRHPFGIAHTFVLLASALFLSSPAHAISTYVDFGGGPAFVSKADPLLSPATGALSSGVAGMMTVGVQLQDRQHGLLFSLGVQQRYLSGSDENGLSGKALPTYPILRVEFWRLMLGAGYSPWVWKDLSFAKHAGASSVLAEATLLFPITVEIDFAVQGAAQYMTAGSGDKGPTPSYEALALFRLNFGLTSSEATSRRKYKGWRYPFGNPNF